MRGYSRCPGGRHSLWPVAITPLTSPQSISEFSTKHTLLGSKVAETKMFPGCNLWLGKLSNKLEFNKSVGSMSETQNL